MAEEACFRDEAYPFAGQTRKQVLADSGSGGGADTVAEEACFRDETYPFAGQTRKEVLAVSGSGGGVRGVQCP